MDSCRGSAAPRRRGRRNPSSGRGNHSFGQGEYNRGRGTDNHRQMYEGNAVECGLSGNNEFPTSLFSNLPHENFVGSGNRGNNNRGRWNHTRGRGTTNATNAMQAPIENFEGSDKLKNTNRGRLDHNRGRGTDNPRRMGTQENALEYGLVGTNEFPTSLFSTPPHETFVGSDNLGYNNRGRGDHARGKGTDNQRRMYQNNAVECGWISNNAMQAPIENFAGFDKWEINNRGREDYHSRGRGADNKRRIYQENVDSVPFSQEVHGRLNYGNHFTFHNSPSENFGGSNKSSTGHNQTSNQDKTLGFSQQTEENKGMSFNGQRRRRYSKNSQQFQRGRKSNHQIQQFPNKQTSLATSNEFSDNHLSTLTACHDSTSSKIPTEINKGCSSQPMQNIQQENYGSKDQPLLHLTSCYQEQDLMPNRSASNFSSSRDRSVARSTSSLNSDTQQFEPFRKSRKHHKQNNIRKTSAKQNFSDKKSFNDSKNVNEYIEQDFDPTFIGIKNSPINCEIEHSDGGEIHDEISNTNFDIFVEKLQNVLTFEPSEVLKVFNEQELRYEDMIQKDTDPKILVLAVQILSKVCAAESLCSTKRDILGLVSGPSFLNQLSDFIHRLPYDEDNFTIQSAGSFFDSIITLFSSLSDYMPSGKGKWHNHLVEVKKSMEAAVKNGIQLDPNLIFSLDSLIESVYLPSGLEEPKENTKNSSGKEEKPHAVYYPEPVGNFRKVDLYPRPEDIYGEQPYLYPNVVKGPYTSVEQYLDTHFKLLREDFMSPIRQAIGELKKKRNPKEKFRRVENVRIYNKVKFLHSKTVYDKVGYEVCFDVDNRINRVNWEYSNRFMFGSLLLFSNDHFVSFFLATVSNRDIRQLEQKRVTVELKGNMLGAQSVLGKEFIMAESEAYFEPYFNVLNALQYFNETNFPLAKYIVHVSMASEPPKYLNPEDRYSITTGNTRFNFTVLDDTSWPTYVDLGLDQSQYQAFKAALTNELAVIQGPPGTGKTFLGLKIAQSLLQNSFAWNKSSCPILVVCLTNHALDQFLEGLLPYTNKLVRIGGKSKGKDLDKFNIRERRKEYSYYKKSKTSETIDLKTQMAKIFSDINTHQLNLENLEDVDGILALETLQLVMQNDFVRGYFQDDDHLIDWLLSGVGKIHIENKSKVTITSAGGVVKETASSNLSNADVEDDRLKQAFFDHIELESVSPSEDIVTIRYACTLDAIHKRKEELLKLINSNKIRNRFQLENLKSDCEKLDLVWKHLRKGLIECKWYPQSEADKQTLLQQRQLRNLQPSERWMLYHTWTDILKNGLMVELGKKEEEFKMRSFRYEQLRQDDDLQILRTSHVVGTTTNTAAKLQPLFTALAPKIVIVEEAAEVLEAHTIASLSTSCEHLILIGDHKQLRPNVAEVRLARHYQLDVSLFERMVNNGMSCHTLTLQHRMRPEISKQLVPTIYPILRDDDSVLGRENIKGMNKNMFFMAHKHLEDEVVEITSKRNVFEAKMVLNLANYLILQGYSPNDITILATYKGQMYHMKNEIKKMDNFPRGIQITVVDNFQGEENKIILLSLVRSNLLNKIGFLEIENRVCVALSRARDGLFIFGNMESLIKSSEIWPHIKQSLVDQQAFGEMLQLRCQVHPNQVTDIMNVDDWRKVSEGGCSLICGELLLCGHACKSMCHIDKEYHKRYLCKEPCAKILCQEGHQCPKRCFATCGNCKVLVRRELPCTHFADVPCSLNIRLFECPELVEVVVEDCRHKVNVPCYTKTHPLCNLPCTIRLECGHTCEQVCHVNDDPDHFDFECKKPCPRLNKDCSLEHRCQLMCSEECLPCPKKVKKELPCGHAAKTLCSTDTQAFQCRQACNKIRSCGHPCDKLCFEPCDPCLIIVEKEVPDCKHKVKVPCNQQATRLACGAPCVVQMECGHKCSKRCRDTCSTRDCVQLKRFKITNLLCGHTNVQIPCNLAARLHNMSEEELMQFCAEPCTQMLTCEHPCSGSCNECMQGRIHKMCNQDCGNVLICGHSCPVPCREVCPPCDKPCRHVCKHSTCPKKCGEVCSTCMEPCDYACEHLKCSKQCGELCDREPCYEPCLKLLDCSHPCVGFCGEPCPPCRQCEPDHFEVFFGTEDEDDARWVFLEDCKHTFESSGLEYWLNMQQDGKEIVSKVCPQCKTPIVKVQRFMNLVKAVYQDIQKVKEQCYGKLEEIRKQRRQCLRKIQQIKFVEMLSPNSGIDGLEELYQKLQTDLPEKKMKGKAYRRNPMDAPKAGLLCFLTEFFVSLYDRKQGSWEKLNDSSKTLITNKINFLTDLLKKREMKISVQEMKSFEIELKRIHRMFDLLIYCSSPEYRMTLSSHMAAQVALSLKKKAEKVVFSVDIYDEEKDAVMKELLESLKDQINSSMEVSDSERAMINKAMGSSFHSSQKTGHWFKCRNGHIYCITECGGAMQEAECPVPGCGEKIGGQHHALRSDQAVASEMDGARYAAWSDQNNMANFGFEF